MNVSQWFLIQHNSLQLSDISLLPTALPNTMLCVDIPCLHAVYLPDKFSCMESALPS